MKKYFYILLLLFSCSPKTENIVAEKTIYMDDTYKTYNASDIFTITSIIKLSGGEKSIIGDISKVEIKNDIVYVLDNVDHKILIYNTKGKLLNEIKYVGRGRGEYISIDDFIVDKKGDVIILDTNSKSILRYDKKGLFVSQIKLPFYADAFEVYCGDIFAFNCSDGKMIKLWDIHRKKEITSFFDFDVKYSGRVQKPIIKHRNKLYYKRNNDNNLYCIKNDTLSLSMEFDFGSNTLSDSDLVQGYAGAYYPKADKFTTCRFSVCDKFITFMFQSEDLDYPFYTYLSSTYDRQIVVTYSYHNNILYNDNLLFNRLPLAPINATCNNELISVINVGRWLNNLKTYEELEMSEADQVQRGKIAKFLLEIEKEDFVLVLYKPKFTLL